MATRSRCWRQRKLTSFRVRDVVRYDGAGTDGAAVLMTLSGAQELLGRPGQINQILVSNQGNATSGAQYTDAVRAQLQPVLDPLGLEAKPVKQDGLKVAEAQGNSFMSMFSTFGTFTIAAGILLIFLVFVLLAAERRGEMGVARAIGTQRGHLVEMFLFEGMAYDLIAAAVGAGLGILIVVRHGACPGFGTQLGGRRSPVHGRVRAASCSHTRSAWCSR